MDSKKIGWNVTREKVRTRKKIKALFKLLKIKNSLKKFEVSIININKLLLIIYFSDNSKF